MDRSTLKASGAPSATNLLTREGYTILRFGNADVLILDDACETSVAAVDNRGEVSGLPW